ncbi:MAG: O-antigen ligase family protein [Eubacterium sp.]|nr:O-antigen ligase family protein [Eubacterium sp.]
MNNTHEDNNLIRAGGSSEDEAKIDEILADKELMAKIMANRKKSSGDSDEPERRMKINQEAIAIVATSLVFFVLGLFIISPLVEFFCRMIDAASDPKWTIGLNYGIDSKKFVSNYQHTIQNINILVHLTAAFLYVYSGYRIVTGWKRIKKNIKAELSRLLPFLIFILFDVMIIVVTNVRGFNEYDRTGHPYMFESIYSYILYPLAYFFCGMMVYKDRQRKIILYALMVTALPLNILALVDEWVSPIKYFATNGVVTVFHNSNHYGYYLALIIITSALLFTCEKIIWLKIFELISMALGVVVLIINNTLGAYLAVGFVLGLYLIYNIVMKIKSSRVVVENYEADEEVQAVSSVAEKPDADDDKRAVLGVAEKSDAAENDKQIVLGVDENPDAAGKSKHAAAAEESRQAAAKKPQYISIKKAAIVLGLFLLITAAMSIRYKTVTQSVTTMVSDVGDVLENPTSETVGYAGSGRWILWKGAFKHILEEPILGFGVEGLLNTYMIGTPHNELLQYAEFFGVPVMLLYVAACLMVLWRVIRNSAKMSGSTMVCFFVTIGYLASSFFGVAIYYTTPFLYIFLGLTYAEYFKMSAPE